MTTSLAQQVILFVIDGLQKAHTPQIDVLITQGAYRWQAHSVTPSVSLPCHLSLFLAVSLLGLRAPSEWSGQFVLEALAS